MKNLLAIIICIAALLPDCKKSSSEPTPKPGPSDLELLTTHQWNLNKEIITTDSGDYAYTKDQVSTIPWASFVFNSNLTYEDHASDEGTYLYYDGTSNSDPALILTPGNG